MGWAILNRPSSINDDAINRLPQVECNLLLEFPTVYETVKAIKLPSSGKAPGSDAIPAEIYKAGGTPVAKKVTELFHIMWRKEASPQEFKDASIIHSSNGKGIFSCVIIFVVSLYCQLLGRSLQEFYLTDWMNTLNRQASTRKPVWIQKGQRNNWYDLHSKAASREMPGKEHCPLHDLCWPYQSIWHSQSWGSLENYGEVLSFRIHCQWQMVSNKAVY